MRAGVRAGVRACVCACVCVCVCVWQFELDTAAKRAKMALGMQVQSTNVFSYYFLMCYLGMQVPTFVGMLVTSVVSAILMCSLTTY